MGLSARAAAFLERAKWETMPFTEKDIRAAFIAVHAPVYQPLIDFQLNYSGLVFYAGLAPIKYTLLFQQPAPRYLPATTGIDFHESEEDSPKYFYTCADTLWQQTFSLDEEGVYYEDYEPVASSFEKRIEQEAVWHEMQYRSELKIVFRDNR